MNGFLEPTSELLAQNAKNNTETFQVIPKDQFLPGEKLLSFKQVQQLVPIGKTRWYYLMKIGLAPKPIRISSHRVFWLASEINSFLDTRIKERNERNKI